MHEAAHVRNRGLFNPLSKLDTDHIEKVPECILAVLGLVLHLRISTELFHNASLQVLWLAENPVTAKSDRFSGVQQKYASGLRFRYL